MSNQSSLCPSREIFNPDGDLNRRVLVIDDNPEIREDYRKIFANRNWEEPLPVVEPLWFSEGRPSRRAEEFVVDCVGGGKSGVALVEMAVAQGTPYAVAFVGMGMPPSWDGVGTIERLWEADADLQIVVCPAQSDRPWPDTISRLGHREQWLILRKPFDPMEVRQLAASLIHKWTLRHAVRRQEAAMQVMERRLRASLAESEGLLAAISSVLIVIDREDCVVRWNPCAERLFHRPTESLLGRPFRACGLEWDWELVETAIKECRTGHTPIRLPLVPYKDPEGENRFLRVTLSPILEGTSQGCGILLLGTDITQFRNLETQLATKQKMEAIGRLAAGFAHEVNTPIHYVIENLRFLQNGFRDMVQMLNAYEALLPAAANGDGADEAVARIKERAAELDLPYLLQEIPVVIEQSREGAGHVADIVRAIKEFSHPGFGERSLVDFNQCVHKAMALASHEWKEIADLAVDLDPALPRVMGCAEELTQVVLNLLVNAAQAIGGAERNGREGKGRISLISRWKGNEIEFKISDSGRGIPEGIRAKVFEPFFTTKDAGQGTGQGLAIVHSVIVEKHHGVVTFDTREGEGTMFIVRLPCEEPPEMMRHGRKD